MSNYYLYPFYYYNQSIQFSNASQVFPSVRSPLFYINTHNLLFNYNKKMTRQGTLVLLFRQLKQVIFDKEPDQLQYYKVNNLFSQIMQVQPVDAVLPLQYQPNFITKQIKLQSLVGFKCIHITFFICWFGLILTGTTFIGYGASIYSQNFQYCTDSEPFCFYDFTLTATKDLLIYAKISSFPQNNRMYLDAYSFRQMIGQKGTGKQCGSYKNYSSFGLAQTSGGYRVIGSYQVHPCGFPMLSLFKDSAYIVQSDGGTPKLSNDTISNYSKEYRFNRFENSSISQWIDPESTAFINWFTIGTTSTKYTLMGKLTNVSAGDYRLIIKNNFLTNGQFTKQVVLSEVSNLGLTNNLLGFALFAYGIGILLVHVAVCCKGRN